MDIGINKPMKMMLRRKQEEWITKEWKEIFTEGGYRRHKDRETFMMNSVESWESIYEETLINSFCRINEGINEFENDLFIDKLF